MANIAELANSVASLHDNNQVNGHGRGTSDPELIKTPFTAHSTPGSGTSTRDPRPLLVPKNTPQIDLPISSPAKPLDPPKREIGIYKAPTKRTSEPENHADGRESRTSDRDSRPRDLDRSRNEDYRRDSRGYDYRRSRSRSPIPHRDEPRRDEPRREESHRDETRRDEPRRDDHRRDELRRDELRRDEPRRDEPRRDEPRREEPRREESRWDEPRRDEPRRDEPHREESRWDDSRSERREDSRPRRETPRKDDSRRDGNKITNASRWDKEPDRPTKFLESMKLDPPEPAKPEISPLATNLSLSAKLEARLASEGTVKLTFRGDQPPLPELINALRLPNLLRLELRGGILYLRLLNATTACRLASTYKNFYPTEEARRILEKVKLSHPSDYYPPIKSDAVHSYNYGVRRRVMTKSFVGGRNAGDKDKFLDIVKKLWGFFHLERMADGQFVVEFDGIETAIFGRRKLELMFKNVELEYIEEKGGEK